MTMFTRRLALASVLALAACGGGDDDEGSTSAQSGDEQPTTTTTLDPEAAFRADIEANITFGSTDPGVNPVEDMLSLATSICDGLDSAASVYTDDAANDSPQTDASVAVAAAGLGLDAVMAADLDDEVTAYVMRAAAEHLCPEHQATVTAYLDGRTG